jgi:hypothetical protein
VILNVNVPAVLAAMVVTPGTRVKPDCEADSPSPEGIGSVMPVILGIPDVAGVVGTVDGPGVLVAVRLEVPVLQAAKNAAAVTAMAAATTR